MKTYTVHIKPAHKAVAVECLDQFGTCCEDRQFSYGADEYHTTRKAAQKAAREFAQATSRDFNGARIIDQS